MATQCHAAHSAAAVGCSTSSRRPVVAARRPAAAVFVQRSSSSSSSRPALRSRQRGACSTLVRAVLNVGDADFEEHVLKSELPVLVDFWATWCGPCKLVAPTMVWAEKEYEGRLRVVKVETDPSPGLVEKYNVYGLPCLILFRGGEPVEGSQREGAIAKKALVTYLAGFGVEPSAATAAA